MNRREKEQREVRYASARQRAEKADSDSGFTALKIPKDYPIFKFTKQGLYRLSILPYLAGKGNPFADEGFAYYERTYSTHRIGTDNKQYCCLKENFHKQCPVCEYLTKLDRWGKDKDVFKALKAKKRQIFALEDQGEKEKGIQILESAYYFGLGQFINAKIEAKPEKYERFFYPKGGLILEVSVKQESFDGRPTYKVKNLEMETDRKDLSSDIFERVPCLDDFLIELPYKEMKEIFLQTFTSQGKEETHSNTTKNNGVIDDDEDDDDPYGIGTFVLYKGSKQQIIKKNSEGELALEDDDGKVVKWVPVSKVKLLNDDSDDDEDEEEVEKASTTKVKEDEEDDDEGFDDSDDDEEDEEEDEDDEEENKVASGAGIKTTGDDDEDDFEDEE